MLVQERPNSQALLAETATCSLSSCCESWRASPHLSPLLVEDLVTIFGPFLCALKILFWSVHRYMSTLYSHPDFPVKGPKEINVELRNSISHTPLKLLTPQKVKRYIEALWKKKRSGQPVTFTDIFGMLIGETLVQNVSIGQKI